MVLKAQSHRSSYFLIAAFICIIFLNGCALPLQQPVQDCPGAGSAAEAILLLKQKIQAPKSLKANGRCRLQYYDTNGNPKNESFNVKVWCNKPNEIYLQGDIAFDPRGIIVGANAREFWLAFRLKEVNSFCWGKWSQAGLGFIEIENEKDWSLSKQPGFDVLTKDSNKAETQKLYISNCDYTVKRIEYLDSASQVILTVELDNYKKLSAGGFLPFSLNIIKADGDGRKESARITFSSIKPTTFNEKQKEAMFTNPGPQGFEHIYKFIDGKFVEQMRH